MLAMVAAALVGVIAWQVAQPPDEPVYKGKRLSAWLEPNSVTAGQATEDAVRQAGTNAIPTLLRMLRAKESPMKINLMRLVQKQHIFKVHYSPAWELNSMGSFGFSVLGTNAQSAVPELIEIANRNISPHSQTCAIFSLGCIGPSAKAAVPSLLRWAVTNANRTAPFATDALFRIDPAAAAKAGIIGGLKP